MRAFINHLILIIYLQAGALFASSLCGLAVGACYIELVLVLSFCQYSSCEPERTVAAIVLVLGIVQCFTGCGGCCWFSSYSSQVITNN